MTWPEFALTYTLLNFAILAAFRQKLAVRWGLLVRTLLGVSAILLVFDALAESRRLWMFPHTLGLDILGVPIENVWIILGSAMNSLLCFLLFAGRLRGRSSRESK